MQSPEPEGGDSESAGKVRSTVVLTRRANGSLRMRRSVERWNFLISLSACVPGRRRRVFAGRCVSVGVSACLDATDLSGGVPPRRLVRFVLAIEAALGMWVQI